MYVCMVERASHSLRSSVQTTSEANVMKPQGLLSTTKQLVQYFPSFFLSLSLFLYCNELKEFYE